MAHRLSWVIVLILSASPAVARAQSYVYDPLEAGWQWLYKSTEGERLAVQMLDDAVVLGVTCRLREETLTPVIPQILRSYWSVDEDGNLYLHGTVNVNDGVTLAYSPAILWIDAPLELGKTWETTFSVFFNFQGTGVPDGPYTLALGVLEEGPVDVPAGAFYAYGVGYPTSATAIASTEHALSGDIGPVGRILGDGEIVSWYSEGLGIVKTGDQGKFELISWSEPMPTNTFDTSWGRIKALYR